MTDKTDEEKKFYVNGFDVSVFVKCFLINTIIQAQLV